MSYCIVLSTSASQEEAEKIADLLLKRRIVSCVQMTPVVSLYHWKGKIERASEIQMLMKTTDDLYPQAEKLIKENHSYEVPQIVKIPISTGHKQYLDWISEETV